MAGDIAGAAKVVVDLQTVFNESFNQHKCVAFSAVIGYFLAI
jgi:hypothetical protein